MAPFKKIITCCILFFSLLIYSCSEPGQSAVEQTYKPGLHLGTGLKYYYTISNETATDFKVNDQEVKNSNSMLVGLLYEIVADTANGFKLKITFDSIHIKTQKGDSKTEIDAAHSAFSADPLEKLLGALKGSSLSVNINSKGTITATSGYDELIDKLMIQGGISDEAQKKELRNELNSLFGNGFIKNNIESLSLFPDSALRVGESWAKQQPVAPELKLDITTSYILTSIADSIASVDAVSDFNKTSSTADILGTSVTTTLQGNQEGNYKIDMRTGLLQKGKSNTSLEGTFQVMGRDVPVKMKITKTLSGKKL